MINILAHITWLLSLISMIYMGINIDPTIITKAIMIVVLVILTSSAYIIMSNNKERKWKL